MFFKKSTIQAFKEHGAKNFKSFIHMYVYARWTDKYLAVARRFLPRMAQKNGKKVADGYHAKVLTTQLAKKIVTLNKEIPLKDLEQIIPYPVARNIVLTNPLDIVAMECPCRASAPNPCSPSMVCMVIGKPFTDFVLEHKPDKAKRITQEEALDLLEIAHKNGWVHSAYFKNVCLDRFYVICNCCKCCCLGLEAMVKHGIPMLAPSGFSARIDKDICLRCGLCVKICPFNAIASSWEIIQDKCMGCGVCAAVCRPEAISLKRDELKGIPLDVEAI
ncbi:MAG: 4Fe-4S binding protein [Clostridia bacterium]|nr:4Fe-4S binding protein [Clostridia bacterium]